MLNKISIFIPITLLAACSTISQTNSYQANVDTFVTPKNWILIDTHDNLPAYLLSESLEKSVLTLPNNKTVVYLSGIVITHFNKGGKIHSLSSHMIIEDCQQPQLTSLGGLATQYEQPLLRGNSTLTESKLPLSLKKKSHAIACEYAQKHNVPTEKITLPTKKQ